MRVASRHLGDGTPGEACLSTYPCAPASIICNTYSIRVCTVTINTRTRGAARFNSAIALMPLLPGRFTSSNTRSGCSLRERAIADSASSASATIFKLGCRARKARIPCRTIG